MCNKPRVNQSSIRYSDEVARIINSCPGDTFGDRFEYVVLDYKKCKAEREVEIKSLDKQIKDSENQLKKLNDKIIKFTSLSYYLENLEDDLKKCSNKILECNTKT